MKDKLVFLTICAKNYTGYSRAFLKRMSEIYPESPLYLFLVDEAGNDFKLDGNEPFHFLKCNEIGIPHYNHMRLAYEITEFSTAVKPFCISYLFDKHPDATVVYMDSDILPISRFIELEDEIQKGANIVLTPHVCEPVTDDEKPNDLTFILAGIYNLGFGAFRNTEQTRAFVKWWEEKLTTECVFELDRGIHVDQKWLDYAPAFVDNTVILRHPGYNLAYWNFVHRPVKKTSEGWYVSDKYPLRFVHFSGNKLNEPKNFSSHQKRFSRDNLGDLNELLTEYQEGVIKMGQIDASNWSYSYDSSPVFKNIPYYLRRLFRRNFKPTISGFNFDQEAKEFFDSRDPALPLFDGLIISRAAAEYHRITPKLHHFDLSSEHGQRDYLSWLEENKIDLEKVAVGR